MEQATNTFNKGLQTDTNPMIQGNDTLTDCLNGTLITMNGNEVILQNDMGNRRVDNAYLPSGYEPVGMKEYGGIIYVAAYNPITNKSQIGSFPSPQKKIDSLDDPSLKGTFYFEQFLSGDSQYGPSNIEQDTYLGINIIKTDSFMVPLTGETSLRAGDKFAIYAPGISQYGSSYITTSQITNFFNTSGNKAYSPKNRRYTLQIGILNSQNEFVDITKTLCRWKNNVLQNYSSEKSDIFKFNDGYFISEDFTDKLSGSTIDDTKLIRKRQKMAANTYAYKLVGPMYLKANLNHIENFNYNIYGTRNDDKSATLWIEGYLSYNCPDGFTGTAGSSNESYSTFSEGVSNYYYYKVDDVNKRHYYFKGFDLIGKESDYEDLPRENSIYNSSNNLYTTKIVKKYTNITANNGTIYDYVIGVLADKDTENIYLKGLSVKGQLDLSLLGSGKVFIDGWRFYNNFENQSTTLTFSFNAYPEYGKSFGNLKFIFKDITDPSKVVTYPREGGLPLYNGRQTYNIEWGEYFEPRKTYEVTVTYNIINENGTSEPQTLVEKDSSNNTIRRWFLTTELFNEFYQPSAGVTDFCNPDKTTQKFNDKMTVYLYGEDEISNNSTRKEDSAYGGLTSTKTATDANPNNINYTVKHSYNVELISNPNVRIVNENLYPDYVDIISGKEQSLEISDFKIKIGNLETLYSWNNSGLKSSFKKQLIINPGVENIPLKNKFNSTDMLNNIDFIKTSRKISGTIEYYDLLMARSNSPISDIENAFCSFMDIVEDMLPSSGYYGGIVMNYDYRDTWIGSARDNHYVELARKQTNDYITNLPEDSDHGENWVRLADEHTDDAVTFYFKNVSEQMYNEFNSHISQGQTFIYIFPHDSFYTNNSNAGTSPEYNDVRGSNNARVWWRTSENEWALINKFLTKSSAGTNLSKSNVKNFLKNTLQHDGEYVYCVWDEYLLGEGSQNVNIYAKNDMYYYNDLYSIPFTIVIYYNKTEPTTNILNVKPTNSSTGIGNLIFTPSSEISELKPKEIVLNLNSSQSFQDYINKFNPDSISNIEISTGIAKDSKGRDLNPNYIYYKETKDGVVRLVRINNQNLLVDREHQVNGKNTLVYNRTTKGSPLYKLDAVQCGHRSSVTRLLYDTTNLVQDV